MRKIHWFLFIIFFIVITIITINIKDKKEEIDRTKIKKEYFREFDLYIKGAVCNIEQQYDTHKFLITLNVLESNQENYSKKGLGAIFCLKKKNVAVFADHHLEYEVGDIIYIGLNNSPLIICEDFKGNRKFTKKSDEVFLYYIAPSLKRMDELVNLGCN
jgi:hypothetical protein